MTSSAIEVSVANLQVTQMAVQFTLPLGSLRPTAERSVSALRGRAGRTMVLLTSLTSHWFKPHELFADHHFGRFHRDRHRIVDLQTHVLDRSFGDRRDELEIADLHCYLRHRLTFGDTAHGSLKLIACAQLHRVHL